MPSSVMNPEGVPVRCPVCGKDIRVDPSTPTGDAPCPNCGNLLWTGLVSSAGKLTFDLARFAEKFDFIIRKATIADLQAMAKQAAIQEMVAALVKAGALRAEAQEAIAAALVKREELGSTGVGNAIAVPHAKYEGVDRVIGSVGWSSQGIDWDSIDKQPVRLVILVVFPPEHGGAYLKALEYISLELRHIPRPLIEPPTAA
ncbi:MAG TPA: PTS sugar transporter subunit IIA [Pirellulales bacterium]|jgi:mannitol/fructose-specific phosphotransferase system IIA component (Ntr-type)|nr:PTS sugar transporter subunit IIA [Pirellulales bacterium]